MQEDIHSFFDRQSPDEANDQSTVFPYGIRQRGRCIIEWPENDSVSNQMNLVFANAGFEQTLLHLVRDSNDGGVAAQHQAIRFTVEGDQAIVVIPGVAGGDERYA